MRFAYADPPYIGQAKRYKEKTEVDHQQLIQVLKDNYPDGWALSLSSPTLKQVLNMCPDSVRVMAWVKPFCVFKPNVNPAYAWEPVIICGGRKRTRQQPTLRDWVSANITLKKGLVGAKPYDFANWIIDILNIQAGDHLDDLFPGTRIISEVAKMRGISCLDLIWKG